MTIIGQLTNFILGPAIHKAAIRGDLNKLKTLIEDGTDPNLRTRSGLTPLMLATQKGHKSVVEFLLSHGADVNAKLKSGFTALFYPCMFGTFDIAKVLIEGGADVNAKEDGNTPLMWASHSGNIKLIELLLANGADPKTIDNTGKLTAANMARGKYRKEILELLKTKDNNEKTIA